MHRFDRPTVLVTKTDLTYTVTLQTSRTLPSDNRQDAVVSQPLLRQPSAETERIGRVEIEMASRSWARTTALERQILAEAPRRRAARGARWGARTVKRAHGGFGSPPWCGRFPPGLNAQLARLVEHSQPLCASHAAALRDVQSFRKISSSFGSCAVKPGGKQERHDGLQVTPKALLTLLTPHRALLAARLFLFVGTELRASPPAR